ncbi:A24 family peptidase [Brevibacillus sp. H7]|jgi:prepilin peptidase CpaA|uniref:A24 family peptidase n=1 Tax=Brevibacillus sp. H7 TaxID=3349138 RepID=UPI00382BB882
MRDVALFLLLMAAACSDWRCRKVSNYLTFPFMAAGLLYQLLLGTGEAALTGVLCAFALSLLPTLFRGMGMGDQKLLMAAGAWTSHSEVYLLFLYSLCSCMLVALCKPERWPRLWGNMILLAAGWSGHHQLWLPGRTSSALSLPYAVHLLAACLFDRLWR